MKWQYVRELYPNQWVHLLATQSRMEGNLWHVDEVDVICTVSDDNATKTLFRCKGDEFVYHTSRETVEIAVVRRLSPRFHL